MKVLGLKVLGAAALEPDLGAVPERRAGPRQRESALAEYRPYRLPGKSAQANDNPQVASHQAELGPQPGRARVPFGRFGFIVGRRAANRGHHPGADQALPVIHRHAGRLFCPSAPVKRREKEISAAIAGEDPSGPVPAVRRGREAHDQQPRPIRPPAGNGAAPVALIAERAAPDHGHFLAPGHQARAGAADRLARDEFGERGRPGGQAGHLGRAARHGRTGPGRVTGPFTGRHQRSGAVFPGGHGRLSRARGGPATRRSRRGCRARSPGPPRSRTAA